MVSVAITSNGECSACGRAAKGGQEDAEKKRTGRISGGRLSRWKATVSVE